MRTRRSGRLSGTSAERLLRGDLSGDSSSCIRNDEQAVLAQLLAAVTGPGTANELAGESAARVAFLSSVTTHPLPDCAHRSIYMRARTLSRIVVAKAVVALALTAGAGGVALAATSASLPADNTETVTSTTDVPTTAVIDADITGETAVRDTDAESSAPTVEPADANGSRGLTGLCRAWVAGVDSNGKRASNPAFTRLIAAAGSDDKVAVGGFCATLTAKQSSETLTATPVPTPATTPTAAPESTAKLGELKRAGAAANTGKPTATGPHRGEEAEKVSGKPDTVDKEKPTKTKTATADE